MLVWLLCVLVCFLLLLSCVGLYGLPGLVWYFLSHIREVFDYNLLKYFLIPFLFVFFFWDLNNSNVDVLNFVTVVSETVFISFHSFFFILLFQLFPPFYLPAHLSILLPQLFLLLVSSNVFFISVIVLFIADYVFFVSTRYLLNISYIF